MSRERYIRCTRCQVVNDVEADSCARCGAPLFEPGSARNRRRRRFTPEGAVLSLLIVVILVLAIFVMATVIDRALHPAEQVDPFAGRSGTTASTSTTLAAGSGVGRNTSTSLPAVLVRPRAATASSSLKPTNTHDYRATNLVDNDVTTAWNEGAEGEGLGEWVKFEFSSSARLARIDVANGYQKDDDRFKGNIRVNTLKLEYSDGNVQLVDLLDTKEIQSITPLDTRTEWVKFTIISVYPDYFWEDAALSEIRVYAFVDQR